MNSALTKSGTGKPLPVVAGHGVFTGYASLFGLRDQSGDIVMPGAFSQSVKRKAPTGIRMLFQHDPAEPIGTWLDIVETRRGLFVRGRIDPNVQRGRELISLLDTGGIDGLSIGFRTVLAQKDRALNARKLMAIDLWEISLVTFPMQEEARITKYITHNRAGARARAEQLFQSPSLTSTRTISDGHNLPT
jgi:uncharacterized protein